MGAAPVSGCSNAVQLGDAMAPEQQLTFGPFRLDVTDGRLWRGTHVVALRPRAVAVLRYLAEHPGRLVTKAELRQHVWGDTYVTDIVLRVCVREIRSALGDAASAPQYVQTVGQEGYRFLSGCDLESSPPLAPGPLVGRQHEVERLEGWFQRAAGGQRQLGFISGEAGVGKTTVVDLLLGRLAATSGVRVGRGQCVEHYGEGEPYLPWLEALGRLARGARGAEVVAAVRRYAPMWLIQLPGMLSELELERLQRQVQGVTPARMVRELAEVLDVLAAEAPLVVVLEDLHWSDRSSVECLTSLAQRQDPARLLVLGTYRQAEVVIRRHPLRGVVQELCGRRQAAELLLEVLPAEDVAAYVAGRLGGPVATALTAFIYERTDGNALFMVNMLEHLVQQGTVVRRAGEWTLLEGAEKTSVPEGLRQLLLRRIESLKPEARRVLEVASVVGEVFTAAAVAAGGQGTVEQIEEVCEGLASPHHFLTDIGLTTWPDGTSTGSYRFQHALYQWVLYEGLGAARRAQLHRRIGARLEVGYGARVGEIAAQLAVHMERGGDVRRAVHAWLLAGQQAVQHNAYHEAIAAFRRGLALLATQPHSSEYAQQELTLQLTLGEVLMAVKGIAAPEAAEAYSRSHTLCQQFGEPPELGRVLYGLYRSHVGQGRVRTAMEVSQELLALAQRQPALGSLPEGHLTMGGAAFFRGDFVTARTHLEQARSLTDSLLFPMPTIRGGFVAGVEPLVWLDLALWALGYADQARQRSQEALALAQQAEHPPSQWVAACFAALLAQCCRDVAGTRAYAEAAMALAAAQGFAHRVELSRILWGWALVLQGDAAADVAHICQGEAGSRGLGPEVAHPYWLSLLAEGYGRVGQPEAGLAVLEEALTVMATTEARWWEAELYRLQGDLLLHLPSPDVSQAEACFQRALEVARRQQARALELRAAMSLSRLWQQRAQRIEAGQLLSDIYHWFTEGFDTSDLRSAKALLEELA
jgi:DNA-binding winged helix-turn-helix (wHTH) protein/predicted ATPase